VKDQPTLAPAPVVQSITDQPFSVALAAGPLSGLNPGGATPAWQEVTPTIALPTFPTLQTAVENPLAAGGAANIATTLDSASEDASEPEVETLELNFGPVDSTSNEPAPQLLIPQEVSAPVDLPSKPTLPVRARARDAGSSNTLLVEFEASAESQADELPVLATPQEFASEYGSGFLEQNATDASATRGTGILRLTAIPKLSPNSFPPLVTLQPAPLDPTAEPAVPYQIVIAPMATEPNRRPIEPRLEAQRLGSVIDATNTLRR
jgi:hypothetical protein